MPPAYPRSSVGRRRMSGKTNHRPTYSPPRPAATIVATVESNRKSQTSSTAATIETASASSPIITQRLAVKTRWRFSP